MALIYVASALSLSQAQLSHTGLVLISVVKVAAITFASKLIVLVCLQFSFALVQNVTPCYASSTQTVYCPS